MGSSGKAGLKHKGYPKTVVKGIGSNLGKFLPSFSILFVNSTAKLQVVKWPAGATKVSQLMKAAMAQIINKDSGNFNEKKEKKYYL